MSKVSRTVRGLHRSVLAIAIAIPMVISGCAATTEDGVSESGSDISTRTVSEGAKLRVTASKLNLRERGSTSARILAVLNRGDLVTCVSTSGRDGWVEVETASGDTGWAFGTYLAEEGAASPSPSPSPPSPSTPSPSPSSPSGPVSGDTCSPTRGQNVVGPYQKALHDTLAFSEGTQGYSKDGYNVIFTFQTFSACASHPRRVVCAGGLCSDAAGRYQFLSTTWSSAARARGLSAFEPEDQEIGAVYLIADVRRATIPQDRALTAAEFTNAITKLSYEWASLPPGQYGQPSHSMAALRAKYCSFAGC